MKIILPDGQKLYLSPKDTVENKKQKCDELLYEFQIHIRDNWESPKIKMFLNVLSDYLLYGNKPHKHEKEILSVSKSKDMQECRKCIPFSSLSKHQKIMLGLVDIDQLPDSEN